MLLDFGYYHVYAQGNLFSKGFSQQAHATVHTFYILVFRYVHLCFCPYKARQFIGSTLGRQHLMLS